MATTRLFLYTNHPPKLGIFPDPHLSMSIPYTVPGDSSRKEKLIFYLISSVKALSKDVDCIIVPGDLCHNSRLDSDDQILLMKFLDLCRLTKIPNVIISGNHDMDGNRSILDFLTQTSSYPNIISGGKEDTYWGKMKLVTVSGHDNGRLLTIISGIDFCSYDKFLDEANKIAERDELENPNFTVLVGHIGVKGTLHGTTKSISGIKKEDIEELSKKFSLIVLGHHHTVQKITKNAFYFGSIHQTRFDEISLVPGARIISLPDLTITRKVNRFSPRFKVIKENGIFSSRIGDNIIKLDINFLEKGELESRKIIDKILSMEPYHLVKPNIRGLPKTDIKVVPKKKKKLSDTSEVEVIKDVAKKTKIKKEEDREEFMDHLMDLWVENKSKHLKR